MLTDGPLKEAQDMDEFADALATDDLEVGTMTERQIRGEHVLIAHIGDRYYATQGRCPHMGGHLADGKLEASVVTCPLHGSQFDLTSGRLMRWTKFSGLALTAAETLRHPRSLDHYDVRVEDGRVLVGPKHPGAQV